jgi:hypothetical protein
MTHKRLGQPTRPRPDSAKVQLEAARFLRRIIRIAAAVGNESVTLSVPWA